jgi:hypothetical protein
MLIFNINLSISGRGVTYQSMNLETPSLTVPRLSSGPSFVPAFLAVASFLSLLFYNTIQNH